MNNPKSQWALLKQHHKFFTLLYEFGKKNCSTYQSEFILTNVALGKGLLKFMHLVIRNGFIDAIMINQHRFIKNFFF